MSCRFTRLMLQLLCSSSCQQRPTISTWKPWKDKQSGSSSGNCHSHPGTVWCGFRQNLQLTIFCSAGIHQHDCWLKKRALRTRPLSASASLVPSVYQFYFQQQGCLLYCLVLDSPVLYIYLFIFLGTLHNLWKKSLEGNSTIPCWSEWISCSALPCRALCSGGFTCAVSVFLLFV